MFWTIIFSMGSGRLKITPADFPDDWEKGIIDLASEGASDVEIRGFLGICHETWVRLINEDQLFSETVKKARDLCRIWWEKNGRLNLETKDFSATLWYMNMKNRFGWADKQEVDHTTKGEKVNSISPHQFVGED